MDIGSGLLQGFAGALTPMNLLFCFIGIAVGMAIGILPGLGPPATIAMLMPLTFGRDPAAGIIMLAGIYYGAKYGGAITSILVNVPGESSSVMTCLDGHQLAKQGKGGLAIGVAAIGGFFGGTLAVIGMTLLAPPIASFALSFGPPEYFALMMMGLCAVTFLGGESMLKGLMMGAFGLMLAVAGSDEMSGTERFTYGQIPLMAGIDFPVVAIGLFAIAEILLGAEEVVRLTIFQPPKSVKDVLPTLSILRRVIPSYTRAGVLGFFMGTLPGSGAAISSFMSYGMEKAVSKEPEKFGTGMVEGVAGPETADNAAAGGALVPILTLGVPSSASSAILLAALMMLGLRPGPLLITEHPEFFWTVVASMYIGNVILLIVNLPMAPLLAQCLRAPYPYLYTTVLSICLIAVYSINNSMWDVWVSLIFGGVGYLASKLDYPPAPLVLGLVVGPLVERSLRQSLTLSRGDFSIFVTRPISSVLLVICVLFLLVPIARAARRWNTQRKQRAEEVVPA